MRFISSIYVFVALLWVTYAAPVPVPQEKGSTENNTPIIHTVEVTSTENDAGGDLFNQFIEEIDLLSLVSVCMDFDDA
ncbi:hypothetical protein C8R43DRAFT_1134695 [Mycena crocata]|nr:hypothetical protein C8R43DRAFT_1134695 [Mycena crocata]